MLLTLMAWLLVLAGVLSCILYAINNNLIDYSAAGKLINDFKNKPDQWSTYCTDTYVHKSKKIVIDTAAIRIFEEEIKPGYLNNYSPSSRIDLNGPQKRQFKKLSDAFVKNKAEVMLDNILGVEKKAKEAEKDTKLGFFAARRVKGLGTF